MRGLYVLHTENVKVETGHLLGTWCRRFSYPFSGSSDQMAFQHHTLQTSFSFWGTNLFRWPTGNNLIVLWCYPLSIARSSHKVLILFESSPEKQRDWYILKGFGLQGLLPYCFMQISRTDMPKTIVGCISAVILANFSSYWRVEWFLAPRMIILYQDPQVGAG